MYKIQSGHRAEIPAVKVLSYRLARRNFAVSSHRPARERERRRRRFESPVHARRFLASDGPIAAHFRPHRHRLTAAAYRETRAERFVVWRLVAGTPRRA
jgi:putative transposase